MSSSVISHMLVTAWKNNGFYQNHLFLTVWNKNLFRCKHLGQRNHGRPAEDTLICSVRHCISLITCFYSVCVSVPDGLWVENSANCDSQAGFYFTTFAVFSDVSRYQHWSWATTDLQFLVLLLSKKKCWMWRSHLGKQVQVTIIFWGQTVQGRVWTCHSLLNIFNQGKYQSYVRTISCSSPSEQLSVQYKLIS